MKTIGSTNEGNVLVEMSKSEHKSFMLLVEAVQGNCETVMYREHNSIDYDLTDAFGAIRLQRNLLWNINGLQAIVNDARVAVGAVMELEAER